MKRNYLSAIVLLLFASITLAKPVKTEQQAIRLVSQSVQKNQLVSLPMCCVSLAENGSNDIYWQINVQENPEKCGKSLQFVGKSFYYTVNKHTGRLKTNAIATPCYINKIGNEYHHCQGDVGEYVVPIDPVSPVIVYQ